MADKTLVACRLSYFGWNATFTTTAATTADRRAEENRLILESYGVDPVSSYVEPGLPFPDYVPVQIWDGELNPPDWRSTT